MKQIKRIAKQMAGGHELQTGRDSVEPSLSSREPKTQGRMRSDRMLLSFDELWKRLNDGDESVEIEAKTASQIGSSIQGVGGVQSQGLTPVVAPESQGLGAQKQGSDKVLHLHGLGDAPADRREAIHEIH